MSSILCEVRAIAPLADDLARVARFCASQAGVTLDVVACEASEGTAELTLHLDPDHASPDHPVWCPVCRLACLCPQTRVGTLVQASACFAPPAALGRPA